MAKRIWGILALLGGLALTVLVSVTMAYDIPANFTVEGEGLEALANLVTKYQLRDHILFIGVGVTMILSSPALLLAPRKVKVMAAAAEKAEAAASAPTDEALPAEEEATPEIQPRLVQVFHTNLLGTAFANAGGRPRQQVLREVKAGDVVACRTVVKRGEDETETVGVFTVKGEQMGVIDLSVLRAIRDKYPDHRIGVTIERISGGRGVPYTCAVRVGVYRA